MKLLFYTSILILLPVMACSYITKNERSERTHGDSTITIKTTERFSISDSLFYSVYELSPKTVAMVINIHERRTTSICDSIFSEVSFTDSLDYSLFSQPKNCSYFDTTGKYKLLISKKLEMEIGKHFDSTFYIYGTKGIAKSRIKNIVFGLDECRTNIIAFILNIDTALIGHPLICSKQLFKFNYGDNYQTIESKIEKRYKAKKYDYADSLKIKVFANLDSLYFTYSDDFQWGKNPSSKNCMFPTRLIFKLEADASIIEEWVDGLDLFGVACD